MNAVGINRMQAGCPRPVLFLSSLHLSLSSGHPDEKDERERITRKISEPVAASENLRG
jgi:hypothetical protein